MKRAFQEHLLFLKCSFANMLKQNEENINIVSKHLKKCILSCMIPRMYSYAILD